MCFVLAFVTAPAVNAQTFTVLHNFTGGLDGGLPHDITIDADGNLYGSAECCGLIFGTVYNRQRFGTSWVFNPLYIFHGYDGDNPLAAKVFGPDGVLYSTADSGGQDSNGLVFSLGSASASCRAFVCIRTETVLYNFGYAPDAAGPTGTLTFDQAGNIYGTALAGPNGAGSVYELARSGNGWTEQVLYGFRGEQFPYGGVIFDDAGNLYGTTSAGEGSGGMVFQLLPGNRGWTEDTLHTFSAQDDGYDPRGGLIFDLAGNLYGTTYSGGVGNGGTIFELGPSHGGWTFTTIYSFVGSPSCGPAADLILDAAGNLYGTTVCDGAYGEGSAFKLTPSGGTWTYTSLHEFCANGYPTCSDGYWPSGRLALDQPATYSAPV